MAKKKEAPQRKKRRSLDERIAELEAKIHAIRQREAEKKAKSDPMLRHVRAARKALEKADGLAEDAGDKRALADALATLDGLMGGAAPRGSDAPRARRTSSELADLADTLLSYVRSNPGQRGEQIAAALGSDTGTIRPVMKRLIADGKVATEGQKRGMTYTAR
jgi:membrane protein involved in colicin uptake